MSSIVMYLNAMDTISVIKSNNLKLCCQNPPQKIHYN